MHNNKIKMEIHNPTYKNETNKIVAYLLPEPIYNNNTDEDYNERIINWQNSRIEIEVDDELRELIKLNCKIIDAELSYNIYDITPIMDRINIEKYSRLTELDKLYYIAKLKQVDKVEDNEKEQIIKFISQRIKDEQRKHEQFNDRWYEIAARKIYASYDIKSK